MIVQIYLNRLYLIGIIGSPSKHHT